MAETNQIQPYPSFSFSSTPVNLQLGKSKRAHKLSLINQSNDINCSFLSRGSSKIIASRKTRTRASPFASMNLAFAAATVSNPTAPAAGVEPKKKKSLAEIMDYAGKKALSGGLPGMLAMGLQVLSLMWLRTTMNYQYRYGTSTMEALRTLYSQGGIPRFYQGLAPALIQGPLSRFGDTAANTGVLAALEDVEMPTAVKTLAASLGAGLFRICLMPVDAVKTIMQVEGQNGYAALMNKVKIGGPTVLFHGALAASLATFVGHYPWFATYNTLNDVLPKYDDLPKRLLRSALMGWCSSFVSDICSNSIRVIKTSKQTSTVPITYAQIVKNIVEKEGVQGLFFRGLGTKLITNGIQGILFSVLWRLGQDYIAKKEADEKAAADLADANKAGKKK
ncbi:hypothetical protein CEUSTIGMA_g11845.t1 [Chlamydomonas eustigma]|uniref:Mitochondrial carrier protein n=1 Tax=Chlamydomonas eustigma TaxID=1157962 RepID=A0A250XMW7_9CHLO|nr:hypothetical protein CEUSTIGMA_g11845.t1 [Chlamydomonas eustigma]|eukprot:GAX84424.1 hypothetical protein CEUSTIGMA_g11845.t1 [Chlamydomonas eustigma]